MERQDKTAEGRLRAAFFLSGCGSALYSALTQEFGEPAGIRTQDPMIKSHVLYRLSYRLGVPLPKQADPSGVAGTVQACRRQSRDGEVGKRVAMARI